MLLPQSGSAAHGRLNCSWSAASNSRPLSCPLRADLPRSRQAGVRRFKTSGVWSLRVRRLTRRYRSPLFGGKGASAANTRRQPARFRSEPRTTQFTSADGLTLVLAELPTVGRWARPCLIPRSRSQSARWRFDSVPCHPPDPSGCHESAAAHGRRFLLAVPGCCAESCYFPATSRSKRGLPLSGAKVGSIRSQPGER